MPPPNILFPNKITEKESVDYIIQNITLHYNDNVQSTYNLWFIIVAILVSLFIW